MEGESKQDSKQEGNRREVKWWEREEERQGERDSSLTVSN